MHPSQWDPKGGIAIGRTKSRLALNGFALISDYEQERDGVITFTGHGVLSFEPTKELYALHWFDCMGSPPEVFLGRFGSYPFADAPRSYYGSLRCGGRWLLRFPTVQVVAVQCDSHMAHPDGAVLDRNGVVGSRAVHRAVSK